MTETELKPCPFCGSRDLSNDGHYVHCEDCGATGPDEPIPDSDWVAVRWNRERGIMDERADLYFCEEVFAVHGGVT